MGLTGPFCWICPAVFQLRQTEISSMCPRSSRRQSTMAIWPSAVVNSPYRATFNERECIYEHDPTGNRTGNALLLSNSIPHSRCALRRGQVHRSHIAAVRTRACIAMAHDNSSRAIFLCNQRRSHFRRSICLQFISHFKLLWSKSSRGCWPWCSSF